VATVALGTARVYEFLADNPAIELWPVNYVNNPRVIGEEPGFISINATVDVDLLGQCASETIGGRYWSSSGGQADFAQGAMFSDGGQGFIVLPSTTMGGARSRIVSAFGPGTVVTTTKNTVDKIVTEFGVAELRVHSIAQRARALIGIAHPDHGDRLAAEARSLGSR
jgi:acyl-CoA hydrolase